MFPQSTDDSYEAGLWTSVNMYHLSNIVDRGSISLGTSHGISGCHVSESGQMLGGRGHKA